MPENQVAESTQELSPMQEALQAMNEAEGQTDVEASEAQTPESEETPQEAKADGEQETEQEEAPEQEPEKEDPKLSKSWSLLTRREKQVREQEKALKAEVESLQAVKDEYAKLQSFVDGIKKDPYSHIEELGISYEDWTQRILGGDTPNPSTANKSEIEALKAEIEALKEAQTKTPEEVEKRLAEQREQAQALQDYRGSIADATKNYKFLSALEDGAEEVMQYAELYFEKTKEILDPADACQAIEEELARQYQLLSKVGASENKPASKPEPESKQAKTLTNDLAVNQPSEEEDTDEARFKAALKAMEAAG